MKDRRNGWLPALARWGLPAVLVSGGGVVLSAAAVFADASVPPSTSAAVDDPVSGVGPSSSGMPGVALVRSILGWGMWLGLAACALVIVYGAATWAGFGSASSGRAVHGKTYVMAGLIGALVIGMVPTAVSMLFKAGR